MILYKLSPPLLVDPGETVYSFIIFYYSFMPAGPILQYLPVSWSGVHPYGAQNADNVSSPLSRVCIYELVVLRVVTMHTVVGLFFQSAAQKLKKV